MDNLLSFLESYRSAIIEAESYLGLEDKGWINLSAGAEVVSADERKVAVQKARLYSLRDPLGVRSIRLMTDYAFGTGISWNCEDEKAQDSLSLFWDAKDNTSLLSPKGQRKSSDKLLVDGEIFLALFLGVKGNATIRRIDPLEITKIISNPDDADDVRYYKREWITPQAKMETGYYRSFSNEKDQGAPDSFGKVIRKTQDALVYHLAINDHSTRRGISYLYPAIGYMEGYREFLKARLAVMLALAKFAWRTKQTGGQTSVDATKAKVEAGTAGAGQWLIENMGSDTQPIRTESGASQAYQDGRMLKLQVAAATGWPEQYYGDISIGNLATAKTVELPVSKMCQSYQAVWKGALNDIIEVVLTHAGIGEDSRYVDIDFPAITPLDESMLADNLNKIAMVLPKFLESQDVQQQALMALGITDVNAALEQMAQTEESNVTSGQFIKALRQFREVVKDGGGHAVSQVQGK